jgi:hypothetical protein
MERTVYGLAIIGAVFAALIFVVAKTFSSEFGELEFHINGETEREPVHAAAAGDVPEQAYAAHSIVFDYVAARIVVTPEARDDIAVSIENPGHLPTPIISASGGRIELDGRLRGRVDDCRDGGVTVRGYGYLDDAELPQIHVRTPMAVEMEVLGAAITEIGPSQTLSYRNQGCGRSAIADVAELLELEFAGSGRILAGNAGQLELSLPGSGDVELAEVSGGAEIGVYGSGNVRMDALTGDLDTTIGGSGAVRIEHGRIGRADISIGGSGSVTLGEGAVDHASVQIGGAGDVRFPGPVGRLDVELGGAGNVSVAGNVGDVNAQIAGVGRVQVGAVTGNLEQQVVGFGGVNVGH